MPSPKVLIIGQPFNNDSGGGITQTNLFGDWDKNNIAVVCTSHMFNNLNTEICDTYYLLGNKEYKWTFPFNYLQRKVLSGSIKVKSNANKPGNTETSAAKVRKRIINNYFYPFLEFIGLFHCISKITLSDKLCKWINNYQPDVVYAQASSRESVLFCLLIQSYIRKPMVFHMMDDWPSTISKKGPFKNFWHEKIDKEFRVLLEKVTVLLSISQDMAQEYKIRYGKDFLTFHNPIDIDFWKSYQRKNYDLGTTPTILYAGRIGPGIETSLETIAKAIEQVNNKFDRSIKFILQTKNKPLWVENYTCVQHKSLVAYSELPMVFAEADFLYLPYDFSEESVRFIKYSMPTKAPEYMISGTPVIMFGPGETALMKDGKRNNWAQVVTDNNVQALANAIELLITDKSLRKQIAGNAINIAETNYDSVKIRNQFKKVISSLVS